MGDIISGVFGGGERQSQVTNPDAVAQGMNLMKLNELANLFGNFDFASFAEPNVGAAKLSDRSQSLLREMTNPRDLMSLDEYIKLGLDEESNYIRQVATPEIMNALSAQGMEGSGALPEAIARATAEIGLPFIQGIPQAGVDLAQTGSNLFSISDIPRQLRLEELNRQAGIVTTGLSALPFTPGSATDTATRIPSLFENITGTGSATGALLGDTPSLINSVSDLSGDRGKAKGRYGTNF